MKIVGKNQQQIDAEAAQKRKIMERAELESYLGSTDWYAIRQAETGKLIPDDVLAARKEARDKLSELKKTDSL